MVAILKFRPVTRALPMLELEAWPKLDLRTLHLLNRAVPMLDLEACPKLDLRTVKRALPMLDLEACPKLKLRKLPLLILIRAVPILGVELEVSLVLEIRAMPLLEMWTVVMLGSNAA